MAATKQMNVKTLKFNNLCYYYLGLRLDPFYFYFYAYQYDLLRIACGKITQLVPTIFKIRIKEKGPLCNIHLYKKSKPIMQYA